MRTEIFLCRIYRKIHSGLLVRIRVWTPPLGLRQVRHAQDGCTAPPALNPEQSKQYGRRWVVGVYVATRVRARAGGGRSVGRVGLADNKGG